MITYNLCLPQHIKHLQHCFIHSFVSLFVRKGVFWSERRVSLDVMADNPAKLGAESQKALYIWVWIQPRTGGRKGQYLLEIERERRISNLLKGTSKMPLSKEVDHCLTPSFSLDWECELNAYCSGFLLSQCSSGFSCMTNKIILMESTELVLLLSHYLSQIIPCGGQVHVLSLFVFE